MLQLQLPSAPGAPPVFLVEHTEVRDFGLGILSDFGGIYLSSDSNKCWVQGGAGCALRALVRFNLIHAGRHYNYGSEGIYTDEQARQLFTGPPLVTSPLLSSPLRHPSRPNSNRRAM